MSQPQTESQRNRRTAKRILAIFLPFVIVAGVRAPAGLKLAVPPDTVIELGASAVVVLKLAVPLLTVIGPVAA